MNPKITQIVSRPAIEAAPLLLGCYLSRQTPAGLVKLKIVETEAYHQGDPASHSFSGLTPRTAPMFEDGGRLYVYFTYGMHYCINIVVSQKGVGEAVLIRAGEPVVGLEIMQGNRGITDVKNLTNGPGKLAQALGIKDTKLSGKILNPAPFAGASAIRLPTAPALKRYRAGKYADVWLEPADQPIGPNDIITAPRIGIRHNIELPWRFYIKNSPFVSKN